MINLMTIAILALTNILSFWDGGHWGFLALAFTSIVLFFAAASVEVGK
jgi:hypothetical protein